MNKALKNLFYAAMLASAPLACQNTDFQSTSPKPTTAQKPTPVPKETKKTNSVTPPGDNAQVKANEKDPDKNVEFSLQSYHIGRTQYVQGGDCDFGREVSEMFGTKFRFRFEVVENNTVVKISIAKACVGPDYQPEIPSSKNFASIVQNEKKVDQFYQFFKNSAEDANISTSVTLNAGTYFLQLETAADNSESIDFVVDGITIQANKKVIKGEVSVKP